MSRTRLDALKPFIAVVRELADILSPFLEPVAEPEEQAAQKSKKPPVKQTKMSGMIFEIVPSPNRR